MTPLSGARRRAPHPGHVPALRVHARGVTVQAIGSGGWAVAERPVDDAGAITVEAVADALRAGVRNDTGWTPRIVVVDARGVDITGAYRVN